MKKVFIIYTNFYDRKGERLTVGGIQSYIQALCPVIQECGMEPIILQESEFEFERVWNDVRVYGINLQRSKKARKLMLDKCYQLGDYTSDAIIFGSDVFAIQSKFIRTISIQHGITWDIYSNSTGADFIKDVLNRIRLKVSAITKVRYASKVVCVDYNFVNWYRTEVMRPTDKIDVIPNFAKKYNGAIERDNNYIRIIFARRFFWYRGTRVFSNAIKKILTEYKNVNVTIAGEGPDERYIREMFDETPNVEIITFESSESLHIHSKHDIAVIPTIGSEGTSLSLLEAMSVGCACVATNVGGMTNIILDGFNGLLVNPNENSIYDAIKTLIENKDQRISISHNAIETVEKAFSYDLWAKKWKELLLSTIGYSE